MTDDQIKLPPLAERPLVTFALFAYNQEKYIREAVEGAFAQTYEPLEIIISDDCSSDKTFEIIKKMASQYFGPHTLKINRNNTNLGLIEHVNKINKIAQGKLIVGAAGDDISYPKRTEYHVEKFIKDPEKIYSIHSAVLKIDKNGNDIELFKPNILKTNCSPEALLMNFSGIIGASHSWTKNIDSIFGPITFNSTYEDLIIGFRSSLFNGISYIDRPLVRYRVGTGILGSKKIPPKNIRENIQYRLRQTIFEHTTLRQKKKDCEKVKRYDLAKKLNNRIMMLGFKKKLYEIIFSLHSYLL